MNYKNLFDLTELEAIEEMAYHGFDADEIAEVIYKGNACDGNMTVKAIRDFDHDGYKAYRKGYLKSQLELRQRIFKDAQHGSSPAQAMAKKILDEAEFRMKAIWAN